MSNFKIGDRIIYRKGETDEDRGVIVEHNVRDSWYVRWDSDNKKLHISEDRIEHEAPTPNVIVGMPEVLVINGVKYVRSE